MTRGLLHRLIAIFVDLSRAMGAGVAAGELERFAIMVHRIMSYRSRQYHTLDHVFGFLDRADEVTALAAIFHDLVYLQVDKGLPGDAVALLAPYVEINGKEVRFTEKARTGDRDFALCCGVFGRDPLEAVPSPRGLNEFLSAFLMIKLVGDRLPRNSVAAALVCIEASIPFRSPDGNGLEMAQTLEERLRALARAGQVALDDGGIQGVVHRAVAFANTDIRDFVLDDPGLFLSNTWKLLPETNYALRCRGAFTVREYRTALYNMLGFFRSLDPTQVFHAYRGTPTPEEMVRHAAKVRENLEYSTRYLRAKLLAVAVIEAVADRSGGDAPMALFMGDIPGDDEPLDSLMNHLAPVRSPGLRDAADPVLRLLRDGRLEESSFDLKNSPLALWLYQGLSPDRWEEMDARVEELFRGRLKPDAFLAVLPPDIHAAVLRACAAMVPTRRDLLLSLIPPGA